MSETSLAAWQEWRERCAHSRCSEGARERLAAFAHARFSLYLRRYGARTAVNDLHLLVPSKQEAWQRFESYIAARAVDGTKIRKRWLFEQTLADESDRLNAVQGGASLIMRNVVRAYLREECPRRDAMSLETPVAEHDGRPVVLADLLPADVPPASAVERREFERLATDLALRLFTDMTLDQRLLVLARDLGIAFSDPVIRFSAGREKSVLYDRYRTLVARLAGLARSRVPDGGHEALQVSLLAVNALHEEARRWGEAEPACAPLFDRAGRSPCRM